MAPCKLNCRATALQALQGADLQGKVAVVTGGNSGIGVQTIKALASAGADVVLCSRSVEAGKAVAEELRKSGVKVRLRSLVLQLSATRHQLP